MNFSRRVLDREGRLLRLTLTGDGKFRLRTPLAAISPEIIRATEWQEDRYYAFHPGINPVPAARSAWHFFVGGGRARVGASTLSMQLARLRFGLRTRTVHGKLLQMFRALELERHYSKAQILEAYLNLAPYGHNVEGIGAAARLYLDKAPSELPPPGSGRFDRDPAESHPARSARRPRKPALTAAQNRFYDRRQAGGFAIDPLDRQYRLTCRAARLPGTAFHDAGAGSIRHGRPAYHPRPRPATVAGNDESAATSR